MKKLMIILGFVVGFSTLILGQQAFTYNQENVLKINPIAFGNSEFQIAYERYFNNRKSSLTLAPSVILKDSYDTSKEGWQLMGQYRFYLYQKNKIEEKTILGLYNLGIYAGLYGLYLDYSEDYIRGYYDPTREEYIQESFNKTVNAQEGGAVIGIQFDITQRIALDVYVGGGVRFSDVNDSFEDSEHNEDFYQSYDVFDLEYQGVKPKLGMLLGITF